MPFDLAFNYVNYPRGDYSVSVLISEVNKLEELNVTINARTSNHSNDLVIRVRVVNWGDEAMAEPRHKGRVW